MPDNDMHYNATYTSNASTGTTANASTGTTANTFTGTTANADMNENNGLALPLPEERSDMRAYPGNNSFGLPIRPMQPQFPQCPQCTASGAAVVWPAYPLYPNYPTTTPQNYGQVRFLNAATNSMTVNISIDGTAYVINSRFATLSNYDWISDGFHTVTVRNASGPRAILLQQTFPFVASQKVTMVLTDAADGGLEMIRVVDTGCTNLPSNSGCFRFANMTYNGSNLDLMLGNETVFRNISYQSVSSYKQAIAGTYQFTAVNAASYSFVRELPIIVIGNISAAITGRDRVLTFQATVTAGNNFTAYLIGNTWSNANLRAIIAQD